MNRATKPVRHKHVQCTVQRCTNRAVYAFRHTTGAGRDQTNYRCADHLDQYLRYAERVLGETIRINGGES